jgi:hypothetical protein
VREYIREIPIDVYFCKKVNWSSEVGDSWQQLATSVLFIIPNKKDYYEELPGTKDVLLQVKGT